MSQFETALAQAQKKQIRGLLLSGLLLVLVVTAVAGIVISSGGTRIQVLPEDAKERAQIELADGYGIAVNNVVYSISSNIRASISAPGFASLDRPIEPHEKGTNIQVTLTELPAKLDLRRHHRMIELNGRLTMCWLASARRCHINSPLAIIHSRSIAPISVLQLSHWPLIAEKQ